MSLRVYEATKETLVPCEDTSLAYAALASRNQALEQKVQSLAAALIVGGFLGICGTGVAFFCTAIPAVTLVIALVSCVALYILGTWLMPNDVNLDYVSYPDFEITPGTNPSSRFSFLASEKDLVELSKGFRKASESERAASREGLTNPGNNCFMNATIQMMFSHHDLASSFLSALDAIAKDEGLRGRNPSFMANYTYKEYDILEGKYKSKHFKNKEQMDAELPALLAPHQRNLELDLAPFTLGADKDAMIKEVIAFAKRKPLEGPDLKIEGGVNSFLQSPKNIEKLFVSLTIPEAAEIAKSILITWRKGSSASPKQSISLDEAKLLRLSLVKLFAKSTEIEVFHQAFSAHDLETRRHRNDKKLFKHTKLDHVLVTPLNADGSKKDFKDTLIIEKNPDGVILRAYKFDMTPVDFSESGLDAANLEALLGKKYDDEKAKFEQSDLRLELFEEMNDQEAVVAGGRNVFVAKDESETIAAVIDRGSLKMIPKKTSSVKIPSIHSDEQITIFHSQQVDSGEFFMQLADALISLKPDSLNSSLIDISRQSLDYRAPVEGQEAFSPELRKETPPVIHRYKYPRFELKLIKENQRGHYRFDDAGNFEDYRTYKAPKNTHINEFTITLPSQLIFSCSNGDQNGAQRGKRFGDRFKFTNPKTLEIDLKDIGSNKASSRYKLSSFTVHIGSGIGSGHYVQYERKTGSDGLDYWICHDDSSKSIVELKRIEDMLNGKSGTATPNLFLFTQVEQTPTLDLES